MHMSINQMRWDIIVCMRSWRASQHSPLVSGTQHYKVLLRDFPAATSLISSAVKVSYLRSASASHLCSEAWHWRMWWAQLYDSWSKGERGGQGAWRNGGWQAEEGVEHEEQERCWERASKKDRKRIYDASDMLRIHKMTGCKFSQWRGQARCGRSYKGWWIHLLAAL